MLTKDLTRIAKMAELKASGFSYVHIARVFNISKQRAHQLLTGYKSHGNNSLYDKLRQIVLIRDNNKCVRCGATETLNVHHADDNTKNNKLTNLITLCTKCHHLHHFTGTKKKEVIIEGKKINKLLDDVKHKYGLRFDTELARLFNVSPACISRYRHNKRICSDKLLKELKKHNW